MLLGKLSIYNNVSIEHSSLTYIHLFRTHEEAKKSNEWVPALRCIVAHSFVALLVVVDIVAVQILFVVDLMMVVVTLGQDKR